MEKENNYIRFDWAIKHMLRDKVNFDILEGFIRVLTKEEVTIDEIIESEANQDTSDDKYNRVDIKAKDKDGHIIIVEVQLTNQVYYLERILYGASKAISEHISLGDNYDKVKKVYHVSILYSDFGTGDDYVYHGQTEFRGLHTGGQLQIHRKENGIIVSHFPKDIFPEYYIIRVNSFSKIPDSPLDEWMEYLKTGKIKENTRTPGLLQVSEKLKFLNMTRAEQIEYERHIDNMLCRENTLEAARIEGLEEGRIKGIVEGRAEGRAEGIKLERINCIKKMATLGIPVEKIAESFGMEVSTVQKILQ